jgi:hypothetical protein
MKFVAKVLLTVFLVICVGVHVYGLLTHFNNETDLSHIIHLLSYSVCLFTFLKRVKFRLWLYLAGLVYPFAYHALCLGKAYSELHTVNYVCLLVVVLLPAMAYWIWLDESTTIQTS